MSVRRPRLWSSGQVGRVSLPPLQGVLRLPPRQLCQGPESPWSRPQQSHHCGQLPCLLHLPPWQRSECWWSKKGCYCWCGGWISFYCFPIRCLWPHGLTTCLTWSCWISYHSLRGWAKWTTSTQSSSNTGPQANDTRPPPSSPQLQANWLSTIRRQNGKSSHQWGFQFQLSASQGTEPSPSQHPTNPLFGPPHRLWPCGQTWSDMNQLIRVNGWKDECLEDIFFAVSSHEPSPMDTALEADYFMVRSWKLILEKVYVQNMLNKSLKRHLCAADAIWLLN